PALPARAVPVPALGHAPVGPHHHVCGAGPYLLVAAGAPVCLRAGAAWHRAHQPVPVGAGLEAFRAGRRVLGGCRVAAPHPAARSARHSRWQAPGLTRAHGRHCRTSRAAVVTADPPLQLTSVRLVIARCSVDYAGRLTAHLPSAPRLLIVKADGSVLVHSESGS